MDRETLLAHRDRWVTEVRSATSSLIRLTPAEQDLYLELVGGGLGERVRLEQERIDWNWVEDSTRRADPNLGVAGVFTIRGIERVKL